MLYSDPKNNVQNTQLNAAISSTTKSFPMQTGDGAKFEATKNGAATSAGSNTVLNSTGILAAGVAAGDTIINLTDKSQAIVKSVTTNQVVTEPLFGENSTDNTWENGDEWGVGCFEATINTKDVDGNITDYENVYIAYVNGDTLVVNERAYNNTVAKAWSGTVYVEVFVTNSPLEALMAFIAQIFLQKANDSEVVHNSGTESIAGAKTFSSLVTLPSTTPTADNHAARKKYVDDKVAAATAGTTGEETAGEEIGDRKLVFWGQGADIDADEALYINDTGEDYITVHDDTYTYAIPFSTGSEGLATYDLQDFKMRIGSNDMTSLQMTLELWTNVAGTPGAKVGGTNTVVDTSVIQSNSLTYWATWDISGISANLNPNQDYFIVTTFSINPAYTATIRTNTTYAHGNKYLDGTWQNLKDIRCQITADIHVTTDLDKIYISDKDVTYRNYVHGITMETIEAASVGTVLFDGVIGGLGTIAKGGTYLLGNEGAITTAAGGANVGRGISGDRLILNTLD